MTSTPCHGWPDRLWVRPERLPFPSIRSTTTPSSFRAGWWAWFASDRAAAEGRVHAFRVALSDRPFEAGTVAWVSEEVESEGFSSGFTSTVSCSRRPAWRPWKESTVHSTQDAQAGIRVVLVNDAGEIVSETFGQPDGAWELRKEGRGGISKSASSRLGHDGGFAGGAGVTEPREANVAAV